mgnify:CR=1 FL=1
MSNYDLMYGDMFTWLLVIVGVILVIYAQAKVNSAYNKYKKIKCSKNINGAEAARLILKKNNLDLYVVETPLKFPSREGNTFVYKGFLTILDLSRYYTRYQILFFRY